MPANPSDNPHDHDPVEARIVAWVLGEASAFEAAELERLCEERPELRAFHRRMLALHGLLTESETVQPDEAWKLSAGKRKAVEDLLGQGENNGAEAQKEHRVRRSGRRVLFAIAACLAVTAVAAGLLAPMAVRHRVIRETPAIANFSADLPENEERQQKSDADESSSQDLAVREVSETVQASRGPFQLSMPTPATAPPESGALLDEAKSLAAKPSSPAASPTQTELAGTISLAAVPVPEVEVADPSVDYGSPADFSAGWGGEDGRALAGGTEEDRVSFAGHYEAKGLATRRVIPKARELAEHAAQEPIESAKAVMSEIGLDGLSSDQALAQLRKAVRDQEDKVEERRKALADIVRTKKIIYKGSDSFYGDQSGADADNEEASKRGLEAQEYAHAKNELKNDQAHLERMRQMLAMFESSKQESKVINPSDELAASEEPYSTFSLNVSDASFQIAQAALARGERPDPAGIKVEQFYNAVDYGDPAPVAGEPVAASIEQTAHPVVLGRNLVRIALKTAAAGRGKEQPLRLTLLADQSGSMVREDRREAMDKALDGLAKLLTEKDLVTVVGFSRTPRLLADGLPGNEAAKLPELINQAASEGGTNLEEAIKLGERMADRRKLEGAQNRIVLLTDGAANLGDADPTRLAENVNRLRQNGIALDIAGIAADDLNDELLGELARKGNGRYYVIGKGAENDFAAQLAGAFRPAAENVKVQVRFNPERVGRYKLIGFEKDRLETEDFRNDAVDAAELAAEEAGVAIYQVEALPDGRGELGEVSVRFRDTASGQMVERTWTISYDAAVPAFDRATPSMQLAVLSMLAAEKLRGGPLADAIDFKQLTAASANVKQFYGNTGRVADVLRMLDALK